MSHDHDHHDLSEKRLWFALLINLMLTFAQIAGGMISGSLALVADALHNLSDAGALGVALIARRIARRPADTSRTFGYQRAELIGALINLTALILIGLYLLYEAAARYFHPEPIAGWIVIYVGGIALIVDVLTAVLTYAGAKHSLNIRAAFLHNFADALGSVAVIASGSLILLYGWTSADLICTALIAAYVLYHGLTEISKTCRILMQSTPLDIDLAELIHTLEHQPQVKGLHHVHVWEIDEHRRSLEGHVVIALEDAGKIEDIKQRLKRILAQRYEIYHSTLEFEFQSQDGGLACLIEAHEPHPSCGHYPGKELPPAQPHQPLPRRAICLTLAAIAFLAALSFRLLAVHGDFTLWLSTLKAPTAWPLREWLAYGLALAFLLAAGFSAKRRA